jgi:hypothetical protein
MARPPGAWLRLNDRCPGGRSCRPRLRRSPGCRQARSRATSSFETVSPKSVIGSRACPWLCGGVVDFTSCRVSLLMSIYHIAYHGLGGFPGMDIPGYPIGGGPLGDVQIE